MSAEKSRWGPGGEIVLWWQKGHPELGAGTLRCSPAREQLLGGAAQPLLGSRLAEILLNAADLAVNARRNALA